MGYCVKGNKRNTWVVQKRLKGHLSLRKERQTEKKKEKKERKKKERKKKGKKKERKQCVFVLTERVDLYLGVECYINRNWLKRDPY